MLSPDSARTPWWTWTWIVLALVVLGIHATLRPGLPFVAAEAFFLIATVFAAVYHAEVVAHRVGEPFGTLVLALAVTIIEVALIVSMMITGGAETDGLARDTVFAAVMIVCNGIVGLCLLAGGVRHREQGFQFQGAQAALSVLIAMTTLTLVLPNVTSASAGPTFSSSQLVFAAVVSLILYGSFLFVQTVRHRDYFLPAGGGEEAHALPPPNRIALISAGLLLVSLVAVVALADACRDVLEASGDDAQVRPAVEQVVQDLAADASGGCGDDYHDSSFCCLCLLSPSQPLSAAASRALLECHWFCLRVGIRHGLASEQARSEGAGRRYRGDDEKGQAVAVRQRAGLGVSLGQLVKRHACGDGREHCEPDRAAFCRLVFSSPEATPASSARTPVSAPIDIGTKANASPIPLRMKAGNRLAKYVP